MFYEIVIDSGESPNKCTIAPLTYRSDFRLFSAKGRKRFDPLKASILLHHEGLCLTTLAQSLTKPEGIACIDCVWRRLDPLLQRIEDPLPTLARIPEGFKTAYPRHSSKNTDPDGGLATIEAIFVAAAILGNWDSSLLSEYYFGRAFISLNRDRFLALGILQAADPQLQPIQPAAARTSAQRKKNRRILSFDLESIS